MKRSSSTMTSAPMAIDNGKQYIMMSSELEDAIELDEKADGRDWFARIQIGGVEKIFQLISVEEDEPGYVICVSVTDQMQSLTHALLHARQLVSIISGESFKSKVSKLEFDRAYLKLLR